MVSLLRPRNAVEPVNLPRRAGSHGDTLLGLHHDQYLPRRIKTGARHLECPGGQVKGTEKELEAWMPGPETLGREELEGFGRILDHCPANLGGWTIGMALAAKLLLVRTREGRSAPLRANDVQRAFECRRGERNIVLKARQMGLTTWTAGRFFLKTITRPGTLTLQVAHTQEAAEEIFRIVHRFVDWLPAALREGPLRTSKANARQIVFPEMDSQVPGSDGR